VVLKTILAGLALLSVVLTVWQWLVAWRFPLHQRLSGKPSFVPPVTVLKPLKGCDSSTESCLRSWLVQDYPAAVQVLFGVASAEDPVCELVRKILREFPKANAQLVICQPLTGANLKIAKLAQLEAMAAHDVLVISDADVRVPPEFLLNVVAPLERPEVGLANCFYRLANPATFAMQWEAIAINADFWSQVLQSQSLKPMDFALGAVMATRRQQVQEIGGFAALADCLADDYQLGNRIARRGHQIVLSSIVVECWSASMNWSEVWKHQLRWARTIRVCQPLPYFFSILSNATLWPVLCMAANPSTPVLFLGLGAFLFRMGTALNLQARLAQARIPLSLAWLALLKDLLQVAVWAFAFFGNRVEWRGERMRLRRDGTLIRLPVSPDT
jgi:ceramide glucosyltransferase